MTTNRTSFISLTREKMICYITDLKVDFVLDQIQGEKVGGEGDRKELREVVDLS